MALPPMAMSLELVSHPVNLGYTDHQTAAPEDPTITPPPSLWRSAMIGMAGAPAEKDGPNTCGWFDDVLGLNPFTPCAASASCTTNNANLVACVSAHSTGLFHTTCQDWMDEGGWDSRKCTAAAVLCCYSTGQYCAKYQWASHTSQTMYMCGTGSSQVFTLFDTPFTASDTSATFASSTPSRNIASSTSNIDSSSDLASSTNATFLSGTILTGSIITTSTGNSSAPPIDNDYTFNNFLSATTKAGIGAGTATALLLLLALFAYFFVKHRRTTKANKNYPNIGGLRDNPSGSLPSDIAPPARHHRASSIGWRSTRSHHTGSDMDDMLDLGAGASEVPVDMRGSGELLAPMGVDRRQYQSYQAQPPAVELEGSVVECPAPIRQWQPYRAPAPDAVEVAELEGSAPAVDMPDNGHFSWHPRNSQAMNSGASHDEAPYRGPAPPLSAHSSLQWHGSRSSSRAD